MGDPGEFAAPRRRRPRARKDKTLARYAEAVGYRCFFDGCCEPINPGGTAGFGAVIYRGEERVWECSRIFHPDPAKPKATSNNVAEYAAFNAILDWFIEQGLTDAPIAVFGDSNLVIQQMFGDWKMHRGLYIPLARAAQAKVKRFRRLAGSWIPREENGLADELSKGELKRAGIEFRIQPEE